MIFEILIFILGLFGSVFLGVIGYSYFKLLDKTREYEEFLLSLLKEKQKIKEIISYLESLENSPFADVNNKIILNRIKIIYEYFDSIEIPNPENLK